MTSTPSADPAVATIFTWGQTFTYGRTRVMGSSLALEDASGPGVDSTCRTHWRFTHSYGELASDSSINGNRLSGTNSGGTASGTCRSRQSASWGGRGAGAATMTSRSPQEGVGSSMLRAGDGHEDLQDRPGLGCPGLG